MPNELQYQIGLTLIEGIGDINAKTLLAYCGSATEVFRQKKSRLMKIPGIGRICSRAILESSTLLNLAEQEVRFIEKYKIKPLFFTDHEYPSRLKLCADSPILLYYKGNADLNTDKIIGVVGTRRPSEYARQRTVEFIRDLEGSGVLVISGLAYGIDILAHKTALDSGLQTVGVLAHGLDRLYPQSHDKVARKMLRQGGLLTDFMSGTNPDAVNFPKRNRIVAGLCDALVVVESKRTGGSLITATIAGSYNRDVFAFPGRAGEALSEGANGLIKSNRAGLIEGAEDLLFAMNWRENPLPGKKPVQIPMQLSLSDDQKKIVELLEGRRGLHIDEICQHCSWPVSRVSGLLLELEFINLVKSRPGKMYERA